MAKKNHTTIDAYEELLRADPFGMFNECGLDGQVLASLLVVTRRLAEELRDDEHDSGEEAREHNHLANLLRAAETIHELDDERFHAAEQILHAAQIPKQFEAPRV